MDVKDSEYGEVQRKTRLLSALKELYSCGRVAAASSEREDSETLTFQQEEEDGVQLQDEAKLVQLAFSIDHNIVGTFLFFST